jgi:RNA polymerase sigma factor (sigma-70 family)
MAATALERRPRRPAMLRPAFRADDARLASRVRDGDDSAFEAIYDRYAPGLLAFCHHMLSNRHDAEDAVQHSLGAAYRMLRAGDREVELRPWLYTVARNRCLSALRARHGDISLDVAPDPGGIPDELVDRVQRRSDLRDLVQDLRLLPDDQRAALVLFELGGLPHDEIATVLDVRREKVKALVFQAREGLMRARRARDTPCTEMRRQLATLAGGISSNSLLRRHVDRCPSCALYAAEVGRQRAGLALILPVLPTVGLKAIVLGSTVGRGTAVAGGGAGAGGGAAVLGSAGGGGGLASAGAGSGAVGLVGAGTGAGAVGSGSILAGAAGGGVSGALATAGGAGTMAAALGAKSATVVVAKLLTVVAVAVGGGAAATGELSRTPPDAGGVPAVQQAASPAIAPSPGVEQLLGPAAPVPTATTPTLVAGGAAPLVDHDPLEPGASDSPFRPAAASQPLPGPGAMTIPAAVDGGPPATHGADPSATPVPAAAIDGPPATARPETAAAPPTTTSAPEPTVGVTTTGGPPASDAPAAGPTTAGTAPADQTPGAAPPATADAAAPTGATGTTETGETGAPGASEPQSGGSPPPTSSPAPRDDSAPPAEVAAPDGTP